MFSGGKQIARLIPQKHIHHKSNQPQTEVAIRSGFKEDLYMVLSGWDESGVTFHVYVNPLVIWIWIGVAIMVLGGAFVLLPDRKLVRASSAARAKSRELKDEEAA